MTDKQLNSIKLFQDKQVRSVWDEKEEKWYFAIIDIVEILTEQNNRKGARNYWKVLKHRLRSEGDERVTFCNPLKMRAEDGKMRTIDTADTQGILRIIQSIPSKKAEPFKQWLATVGAERIEEIANPELAAKRAHDIYKAKGYSEEWIEQRERGITARNQLTDEWQYRGAENGRDYAILTNEIYTAGFGLTAKDYKNLKGVSKNQNLRDSMTNLELAITNLGEVTAKELHRKNDSYGMNSLKTDMKNAGKTMKAAKDEAEKQLNRPIVSNENYLDLQGKRKKLKK